MENGNIIINTQAEDDEEYKGVAGDSKLPEQEEMENEELIIGSEEVEDWEQVEQDA